MLMELTKTRRSSRPQDFQPFTQQTKDNIIMLMKMMMWSKQSSLYPKMFSKVNKTKSIRQIQTIVLSSRIVKNIREIQVWRIQIKLKVKFTGVTCNIFQDCQVRYTIKIIRIQVSFRV